ncbi:hypothetical protein CDAR_422141 [Caerostris darwini]|uniref:Uncharacterized protein n=1 Tax=Caerostris darwini TaxID=1538125 RepID=A0AAV4WSL9_9ARAC|nr:hypothetical protein CDAR_422141 [Caerostris darwini]
MSQELMALKATPADWGYQKISITGAYAWVARSPTLPDGQDAHLGGKSSVTSSTDSPVKATEAMNALRRRSLCFAFAVSDGFVVLTWFIFIVYSEPS